MKMTKAQQIKMLIDAGLYDIQSPGALEEIRSDFYAPGSTAMTPEKVLREARREANMKKVKKPIPIKPLSHKERNDLLKEIQCIKKMCTIQKTKAASRK